MKMKKIPYILLCLFLTCCAEDPLADDLSDKNDVYDVSDKMSPTAVFQSSLPPLATKALISNDVSQSFNANFLRIDEDIEDNAGSYTYSAGDPAYNEKINWEDSYLVEASVVSTSTDYRRSVSLNPEQIYRYKVTDVEQEKDTVFYHTRMVSWYPQTCILHKNEQGTAAVTKFRDFNAGSGGKFYSASDGVVSILFTGLKGETDVMVSNVKEAQHWHLEDQHKTDGEYDFGTYTAPYGYYEGHYENYLTYKHYMSAVKVYAFAEESQQMSEMWGRINEVYVKNQPSEVKVSLPSDRTSDNILHDAVGTEGFGTAVFNDESKADFPLVKTAMKGPFEENPEIPEDNPIVRDGEEIYLGYAMVQPDAPVVLEVHTEAGVFEVEVPVQYTYKEKDSNGQEQEKTAEVFKAGYIYTIRINFKTEGAIAELLFNEGSEKYYDLTTGGVYGQDDSEVYALKHANCYIIHDGIKIDNDTYYDGYLFNATIIGNGESGLYPNFHVTETATISPVRAGLIWESEDGLITQVQLKYGHVRFKVKGKNPGAGGPEGNAVIGVYDSNRQLLWSWHIWITDKPLDQEFYLDKNKKIVLLDRNLGATASTVVGGKVLETYGLYYQWGRKDPTMGPPLYDYKPMSTATAPYWDYYGDQWDYTGVVMLPEPTLSDAVTNPMYLLLPTNVSNGYQYDWLYNSIDYLWGDYSRDANARLKTIYDPCPFGYMVPQDEITTMFDIAANDKTTYLQPDYNTSSGYGMTIIKDAEQKDISIFFPYAGYKGVDKGVSSLTSAWRYVGEKGDYMSSKIDVGDHRSRTYISKVDDWTEQGADINGGDGIGDISCHYRGHIYPDSYANRRVAGSVRCIKRESALNSSISANFYPVSLGYELSGLADKGTIDFEYNIVSNQSELSSVTFSSNSNVTAPAISNVDGKTRVSGTVQFPKPGAVGAYRYSMTVKNKSKVSTTKWTSVYFLSLSDSFNAAGTMTDGKYNFGTPYTIDVVVEGVDSDCKVIINGVEASSSGFTYSVTNAYIAGHVMVQILDPLGQVIITKEYEAAMNDASATSYKVEKEIAFATEMEGGAMYVIRAYNSPYDDYYWQVNDSGNLVMTKVQGDVWSKESPVTFSKDQVFIFHRDDSKGSISGYSSVSVGAWKSLSKDKFMNSSMQFNQNAHGSAQFVTLANNWGGSLESDNVDMYQGSTGKTLYFNTQQNVPNGFGWSSSVGSYDGRRKWVIYKVTPAT